MTSSKEIDQLAGALVAAQTDFKAIDKTDFNPFFKSKYAGLPAVVEAAQPILSKHGLAISQHIDHVPVADAPYDTLITYLLHSSGQYISSEMLLHLPKTDPQGQGSAVTYARRYAYMAALGLVADVDDDAEAATVRPVPTAPKAPPQPPQKQTPEARVSAADAKRELILDAVEKGHDDFNAKVQAKKAWGDRGAESILRGELLLLLMSIERVPAS
jgi:ERF superfamily